MLKQEEKNQLSNLDKARADVEALKKALDEQDDTLARTEFMLTRAKEINRSKSSPAKLIAIAASLTLVGGFVAYLKFSTPTVTVVESSSKPITLRFPADHSLGALYVKPRASFDQAEWLPVEQGAQGEVSATADQVFRLDMTEDAAQNLSALRTLQATYFWSLSLPRLIVNDENLEHLKYMSELRQLSVNSNLGDENKAAINAVLPNLVIEDKPPEAISYASLNTPPQARILNFPAQSIGTLFTRNWTEDGQAEWSEGGEARGDITVPKGVEARLRLGYDVSDLSALDALQPDALQGIIINGPNVADDDMVHVGRLTGLLYLEVQESDLTDAGIRELAAISHLRTLELRNVANLTDEGLKYFSQQQHLYDVAVTYTKLTNASVNFFKGLPSLTKLYINSTSGVTEEGIISLKTGLPKCEVMP